MSPIRCVDFVVSVQKASFLGALRNGAGLCVSFWIGWTLKGLMAYGPVEWGVSLPHSTSVEWCVSFGYAEATGLRDPTALWNGACL